jgi:hypothetical protein
VLNWLPEWLFEGQLTVYAVLAVALIFLIVIWKQTPRKAYLVGCILVAVLIGLYALLDFLVQTDREQIMHSVQEMSAGVEGHDVNRIFSQISETYNRHGMDKASFRRASASVIDSREVEQMVVWGYEFGPDYKSKESPSEERATRAIVRFMAKPTGAHGTNLFQVEAVMHRDSADGVWRLQSWEVFDPFHEGAPVVVPQVP